eukprot:scaffold54439_cov38-Tisochrysis_lutea.AAC.5
MMRELSKRRGAGRLRDEGICNKIVEPLKSAGGATDNTRSSFFSLLLSSCPVSSLHPAKE